MDHKAIDRAVRIAQQWNVFRPLAEKGFSPADIKQAIIAVLDPYFSNKNVLEEYAIGVLGSEAFRVSRIKQDAWAERAFEHVSSIYRDAEAANAEACYKACAESEADILAAVSEHWSLLYLEIDKADLSLEEFRHEAFRNIGALVEAYLFPHLRDLLVQVRLIRGKEATYAQIVTLKLGNVVNELHDTLSMPELVAPPPWSIWLNQWRNIAQHYRSRVRSGLIYSYFGEPPNEQEVIFRRNELWDALTRIYSICDVVNTARTLFIIDNIKEVHKYFPGGLELRTDAYILSIGTALSTQGFELAGLQQSNDTVVATVHEMSNGPTNERMIHASQFVYPVWSYFPKETVIVKYIDRGGTLRLITTAKGDDCKRIADGTIPFAELANLVEFRSEGEGNPAEGSA